MSRRRFTFLITTLLGEYCLRAFASHVMAQPITEVTKVNASDEEPWRLSPALVIHSAAKRYQKKIQELAHGHLLDRSASFLQRSSSILSTLRQQASRDFPETQAWQWELHTSDEAEESSYCMAGGKLLISLPQAQRMSLNDMELAMLISHEMAHALLHHHFLEDREALRRFPSLQTKNFEDFQDAVDEDDVILTALAEFDKAQEYEADLVGFQLALRAGFAGAMLIRFFEKLRKHSAYPNFDSKSHPAPAQRLQRLRTWYQQQTPTAKQA
ncbi:M48 family metalloprotease [Undibacterium cyanobacteriorum]|uniref:M48 family metalloprotease n=1 Tax=Undibacterium cyanobacteriorum TaxID=3073561 RepID=A0ABY9RJ39_9BURK|nr:M48 family metalloprotease [Undibacterium sp. 20NA77.5]WMW80833.1 M48 family metalloprotease [Undibacterium sp. 20NA77.5]